MTMANLFTKDWDHKIELGALHRAKEAGTMTVGQVAKELREQLLKIQNKELQEEMECALNDLGNFGPNEDDEDAQEDYNIALGELYDIGDYQKRIWFNVF